MALPETVQVRISSEAAESIALTPVVVQSMPLRELVRQLLVITGLQPERIRYLLERGTFVSGTSRFRWAGFAADPAELDALLAAMPAADPSRPFSAQQCRQLTCSGKAGTAVITREIGQRKHWWKRRAFWDEAMRLAAAHPPQYRDYSYTDQADRYEWTGAGIPMSSWGSLADLLSYSSLRPAVRHAERVEFLTTRSLSA